MDKILTVYARDKKYHPYGCMVAILVSGHIRYGWSLCHREDQFCKKTGRAMALVRALGTIAPAIPRTLQLLSKRAQERARRYFKVEG